MNEPAKKITLDDALGFRDFEVKYWDGSAETIRIYHIPIRDFSRFAEARSKSDLIGEVALYCRRGRDWVETLTDDSLFDLRHAGAQMNDPRFARLMAKRAESELEIQEKLIAPMNLPLANLLRKASLGSLPAATTGNS